MPRYEYCCSECKKNTVINHLSDEMETDCPQCKAKGSLTKALTRFSTPQTTQRKQKIGEITEQFIQDSHQELKQQKKELNKIR